MPTTKQVSLMQGGNRDVLVGVLDIHRGQTIPLLKGRNMGTHHTDFLSKDAVKNLSILKGQNVSICFGNSEQV